MPNTFNCIPLTPYLPRLGDVPVLNAKTILIQLVEIRKWLCSWMIRLGAIPRTRLKRTEFTQAIEKHWSSWPIEWNGIDYSLAVNR
jgi:hypothetical protein